jgi:protein-disulfide isomerase
MSRRFLIILVVLAVLFGGFLVFSKTKQNSKKSDNNSNNSSLSNHTAGKGTKGVTLVEYGDFQCPACGSYYPTVEEVRQKYGDDITFQFRNFPLVQIHQNAMVGHRAAEAADKQGKYWEMYNALYKTQQTWSVNANPTAIIESYAAQLGLNVDQFKKDYQSAAVNDTINADIKAGQALGVSSTPTFFINGKKLDPSPDRSVEAFSTLIDEAIRNSSSQKSN